MQRVLIYILTVGSIASGAEAGSVVQLCSRNRRYVETANADPLFLVGYHAHNLDLDNSIGYETLLQYNAQNRINYVRYFPFSARMMDTEGDRRWILFARVAGEKVDLGQWNEENWARIRRHLDFMRDHGMIAHISIFEGCIPWKVHPFNPRLNVNTDLGDVDRDGDGNGYEQGEFFDVEALTDPTVTAPQKALKRYQERYVTRLLAETSRFPNVMYEIGNELPNPGAKWVQYWVKFIRDRCENMITYNGKEGLTDPGFDGATDHVHRESNVRRPFGGNRLVEKTFVVSSSDGGEITNIGSDGGRRCLWKAFTAGLGGWSNYSSDFYVTNADEYYYSAESPGRYNFRKALYYYNAIGFIHDWNLPFPEMTPRQDVITKAPPTTEVYGFAGRGEYVVYLSGETLRGTLALQLQPASKYGYWYNPRSGAFFESVNVKDGENVLTIPKTTQDLVFYAGRPRTEMKVVRIRDEKTPSPTIELQVHNVGEKLLKNSVRAEFCRDALESFSVCPEVLVQGREEAGERLKITIKDIPFGEPGVTRNWVRISVATESGRRVCGAFVVIGREEPVITLGESDVRDGLIHVQNQDGRTIPATMSGRSCRRNADPENKIADRYFYFSVDNAFAFAGSPNRFLIRITYLDVPGGVLSLQYDARGQGTSNIYRAGGDAQFDGTGRWRTHTFQVDDAFFADRQNNGADFRLFVGEDKIGYIHKVELAIPEESK